MVQYGDEVASAYLQYFTEIRGAEPIPSGQRTADVNYRSVECFGKNVASVGYGREEAIGFQVFEKRPSVFPGGKFAGELIRPLHDETSRAEVRSKIGQSRFLIGRGTGAMTWESDTAFGLLKEAEPAQAVNGCIG